MSKTIDLWGMPNTHRRVLIVLSDEVMDCSRTMVERAIAHEFNAWRECPYYHRWPWSGGVVHVWWVSERRLEADLHYYQTLVERRL